MKPGTDPLSLQEHFERGAAIESALRGAQPPAETAPGESPNANASGRNGVTSYEQYQKLRMLM